MSALDVQVGGSHYKGFVIQPAEFSRRNKLGFIEGCIVKRICRYNQPGGKGRQDLEKIKHEIDLILAIDEAPCQVQSEPDWEVFLAWVRGEISSAEFLA